MSSTPQQYNRTRGPALSVLVMETLREAHSTGNDKLSTRSLAKRLAAANGQHTPQQISSLYYRVRIVVRNLAEAGLINTESTYDKRYQVNVTLISISTPTPQPCSE